MKRGEGQKIVATVACARCGEPVPVTVNRLRRIQKRPPRSGVTRFYCSKGCRTASTSSLEIWNLK